MFSTPTRIFHSVFFVSAFGIAFALSGSPGLAQSTPDRGSTEAHLLRIQAVQYTPEQIGNLQAWLADLGYESGVVDGIADRDLAAAIGAFEADQGLPPLGMVTDEVFSLVAQEWQGRTGTLQRMTTAAADTVGAGSAGANPAGGESCAALLAGLTLTPPASRMDFELSQADINSGLLGDEVGTTAQLFYTNEADNILIADESQNGVSARDGDDTIFVFNPGLGAAISADGGGDTIHICSLSKALNMVAPAEGMPVFDSMPDTIVIHAAAFAAASAMGHNQVQWLESVHKIDGAQILIPGFDARTDRIILRSPEPVTPQIIDDGFTAVVRAGPIEFRFLYSSPDAPSPLEGFIVETATTEDVGADQALTQTLLAGGAEEMFGLSAAQLAGLEAGGVPEPGETETGVAIRPDDPARASAEGTCETLAGYTGLDPAEDNITTASYGSRYSTWRDSDDAILLRGDGDQHFLVAGGGDDQIWLYDMSADSYIMAGPGADLVVLCSMEDVGGTVGLGNGDQDADTLVIGPDVLRDIPAGFTRQLILMEFQPEFDRLILPAGDYALEIDVQNLGLDNVITYGPLRITLLLSNLQDESRLRAAVRIGALPVRLYLDDMAARSVPILPAPALPVDPASWAAAHRLSGGPPPGAAPMQTCDHARMLQTVSAPVEEAPEHSLSALFLTYGDGDDTVVLRSVDDDPVNGILTGSEIATGAGDDMVHVFTGHAAVDPGPGADTVLVCALDALVFALSAAADGEPDTIIVDSGVFLTPVVEHLYRNIATTGFGDPTDRLVVRLPPGAAAKWDEIFGLIVVANGYETRISVGPTPDDLPPRHHIDPDKIVIWPLGASP